MRIRIAYLLTLLLLLFLTITFATVTAEEPPAKQNIYLPLVGNGQEYIIDCMDKEGNFIPCPGE